MFELEMIDCYRICFDVFLRDEPRYFWNLDIFGGHRYIFTDEIPRHGPRYQNTAEKSNEKGR